MRCALSLPPPGLVVGLHHGASGCHVLVQLYDHLLHTSLWTTLTVTVTLAVFTLDSAVRVGSRFVRREIRPWRTEYCLFVCIPTTKLGPGGLEI